MMAVCYYSFFSSAEDERLTCGVRTFRTIERQLAQVPGELYERSECATPVTYCYFGITIGAAFGNVDTCYWRSRF